MANRQRSKRRRKGTAGGATYGRPSAGPAGAPISSDELVFGTADELREMAAAMRKRDPTTVARAASASASRVKAYRSQHPDADPATLVGRPICEAPAPARRRTRARREGLRVAAAAGPDPAELWIDDYIEAPNPWGDGISARDVREALDEIGDRDVVVHLNSGGGDFFEGVAIYQALRDHGGQVYAAVDALAASAASLIAMAGDTVGIGDMAFIMIHEARGFAYGNADDMLTMATTLDQIGETMANLYAKRGPATSDAGYWRAKMKAETWLGADAAIEEGLADVLLEQTADPEASISEADRAAAMTPDEAIVARYLGLPAASTTPDPAPVPDPTPDPVDMVSALFTHDDEYDLEALTA